jgi:hypothetical protein
MALFVDQMAEAKLGYSLLEVGAVRHVSRVELASLAKTQEVRPSVMLPGAKRPAGFAGDYKQAYALGKAAERMAGQEGCPVVAVLFRDSDGTNSAAPNRWESLVDAIRTGFVAAACKRGVPMVPKPKQEAWFLCALKKSPYENCASIEEGPGNDRSPNSLKKQLRDVVGRECDADCLIELVRSRAVDSSRISMPSFNIFRRELLAAIDKA